MKKILSAVIVLLMMCGVAACGPKSDVDMTAPSTTGGEQKEDTTEAGETKESVSEEPDSADKDSTFQIPGQKIYFTCPQGWSYREEGTTTAIYNADGSLVGVCYDWFTEFDGALEDIVGLFSESFAWDTASLCKGYIGASSIEVLTTERTTVAGMESVRFTGTIKNNSWDCHLYGYTYQVEGVNLMVVGLVSAQEQNPDMIAEIDALTDQIAASVRTEE